MRAVDAPESLNGEVFGRGRIADDAQNPAVDLVLKPAKQGLKSGGIASRELFCEILQLWFRDGLARTLCRKFVSLSVLPGASSEGFI